MNTHLLTLTTIFSCLVAISTSLPAQGTPTDHEAKPLTELVLLPTIHRNHLKSKTYGLKRLESVIHDIKPEIVCTEITPPSLAAHDEGKQDRRLALFPEYTKVILPLRKELNYKVIPCSAYTSKVNFKTVGVKTMDKAHYGLIAKALDRYQGQGKKILITFGGGHIDGLLHHLRKRKDIKIIDYRPILRKLPRNETPAKS